MDSCVVDKVKEEFPGREYQINLLYKFILEEDKTTTMDFLLYGPPNTGKTSVIKKLLKLLGKSYIVVDCNEFYHPRYLFQAILKELRGVEPKDRECNNIVSFMNNFEKLSFNETSFDFIIIKNCSSLGEYFVQAFINLQSNFSIIFIDQRVETYASTIGSHLNKIYFPAYTKDELSKIIPLLRSQYDSDLFGNFLIFFLSCVYHLHRDIFEILQLVDVFFAIYKKPIDDGELNPNDRQSLYKRIVPHLKMNSSNLVFSFPQSKYPHEDKLESMQLCVDTELSRTAKFLLIASYIASFVSAKNDKRLFCIKSSKQKKKIQIPNGNQTENKVSSLLGPKHFSLNRLLSIYSALCGRRVCFTTSVLQQIAFLVEIKLMILIGGEDCNLDNPRYKCIADFDFVSSVAKSVECELERYLVG